MGLWDELEDLKDRIERKPKKEEKEHHHHHRPHHQHHREESPPPDDDREGSSTSDAPDAGLSDEELAASSSRGSTSPPASPPGSSRSPSPVESSASVLAARAGSSPSQVDERRAPPSAAERPSQPSATSSGTQPPTNTPGVVPYFSTTSPSIQGRFVPTSATSNLSTAQPPPHGFNLTDLYRGMGGDLPKTPPKGDQIDSRLEPLPVVQPSSTFDSSTVPFRPSRATTSLSGAPPLYPNSPRQSAPVAGGLGGDPRSVGSTAQSPPYGASPGAQYRPIAASSNSSPALSPAETIQNRGTSPYSAEFVPPSRQSRAQRLPRPSAVLTPGASAPLAVVSPGGTPNLGGFSTTAAVEGPFAPTRRAPQGQEPSPVEASPTAVQGRSPSFPQATVAPPLARAQAYSSPSATPSASGALPSDGSTIPQSPQSTDDVSSFQPVTQSSLRDPSFATPSAAPSSSFSAVPRSSSWVSTNSGPAPIATSIAAATNQPAPTTEPLQQSYVASGAQPVDQFSPGRSYVQPNPPVISSTTPINQAPSSAGSNSPTSTPASPSYGQSPSQLPQARAVQQDRDVQSSPFQPVSQTSLAFLPGSGSSGPVTHGRGAPSQASPSTSPSSPNYQSQSNSPSSPLRRRASPPPPTSPASSTASIPSRSPSPDPTRSLRTSPSTVQQYKSVQTRDPNTQGLSSSSPVQSSPASPTSAATPSPTSPSPTSSPAQHNKNGKPQSSNTQAQGLSSSSPVHSSPGTPTSAATPSLTSPAPTSSPVQAYKSVQSQSSKNQGLSSSEPLQSSPTTPTSAATPSPTGSSPNASPTTRSNLEASSRSPPTNDAVSGISPTSASSASPGGLGTQGDSSPFNARTREDPSQSKGTDGGDESSGSDGEGGSSSNRPAITNALTPQARPTLRINTGNGPPSARNDPQPPSQDSANSAASKATSVGTPTPTSDMNQSPGVVPYQKKPQSEEGGNSPGFAATKSRSLDPAGRSMSRDGAAALGAGAVGTAGVGVAAAKGSDDGNGEGSDVNAESPQNEPQTNDDPSRSGDPDVQSPSPTSDAGRNSSTGGTQFEPQSRVNASNSEDPALGRNAPVSPPSGSPTESQQESPAPSSPASSQAATSTPTSSTSGSPVGGIAGNQTPATPSTSAPGENGQPNSSTDRGSPVPSSPASTQRVATPTTPTSPDPTNKTKEGGQPPITDSDGENTPLTPDTENGSATGASQFDPQARSTDPGSSRGAPLPSPTGTASPTQSQPGSPTSDVGTPAGTPTSATGEEKDVANSDDGVQDKDAQVQQGNAATPTPPPSPTPPPTPTTPPATPNGEQSTQGLNGNFANNQDDDDDDFDNLDDAVVAEPYTSDDPGFEPVDRAGELSRARRAYHHWLQCLRTAKEDLAEVPPGQLDVAAEEKVKDYRFEMLLALESLRDIQRKLGEPLELGPTEEDFRSSDHLDDILAEERRRRDELRKAQQALLDGSTDNVSAEERLAGAKRAYEQSLHAFKTANTALAAVQPGQIDANAEEKVKNNRFEALQALESLRDIQRELGEPLEPNPTEEDLQSSDGGDHVENLLAEEKRRRDELLKAQQALKDNPDSPDGLSAVEHLLAEEQRRKDELRTAQRALDDNPDAPEGLSAGRVKLIRSIAFTQADVHRAQAQLHYAKPTERREAESRLEASRARLQDLEQQEHHHEETDTPAQKRWVAHYREMAEREAHDKIAEEHEDSDPSDADEKRLARHFSTLNRVESSRARLREAEVTLEESPEGDRDAARQHVESARVEHEDKKTEEGALLNESNPEQRADLHRSIADNGGSIAYHTQAAQKVSDLRREQERARRRFQKAARSNDGSPEALQRVETSERSLTAATSAFLAAATNEQDSRLYTSPEHQVETLNKSVVSAKDEEGKRKRKLDRLEKEGVTGPRLQDAQEDYNRSRRHREQLERHHGSASGLVQGETLAKSRSDRRHDLEEFRANRRPPRDSAEKDAQDKKEADLLASYRAAKDNHKKHLSGLARQAATSSQDVERRRRELERRKEELGRLQTEETAPPGQKAPPQLLDRISTANTRVVVAQSRLEQAKAGQATAHLTHALAQEGEVQRLEAGQRDPKTTPGRIASRQRKGLAAAAARDSSLEHTRHKGSNGPSFAERQVAFGTSREKESELEHTTHKLDEDRRRALYEEADHRRALLHETQGRDDREQDLAGARAKREDAEAQTESHHEALLRAATLAEHDLIEDSKAARHSREKVAALEKQDPEDADVQRELMLERARLEKVEGSMREFRSSRKALLDHSIVSVQAAREEVKVAETTLEHVHALHAQLESDIADANKHVEKGHHEWRAYLDDTKKLLQRLQDPGPEGDLGQASSDVAQAKATLLKAEEEHKKSSVHFPREDELRVATMSVASAEALVQHEKGRLEMLEKLHAGDPTDTVYEVRLAQQTRDVAVAERDLLHAQEHQAKVAAGKEKKGKEWDEASARAKLRKGETKEARNSAEQGHIDAIDSHHANTNSVADARIKHRLAKHAARTSKDPEQAVKDAESARVELEEAEKAELESRGHLATARNALGPHQRHSHQLRVARHRQELAEKDAAAHAKAAEDAGREDGAGARSPEEAERRRRTIQEHKNAEEKAKRDAMAAKSREHHLQQPRPTKEHHQENMPKKRKKHKEPKQKDTRDPRAPRKAPPHRTQEQQDDIDKERREKLERKEAAVARRKAARQHREETGEATKAQEKSRKEKRHEAQEARRAEEAKADRVAENAKNQKKNKERAEKREKNAEKRREEELARKRAQEASRAKRAERQREKRQKKVHPRR